MKRALPCLCVDVTYLGEIMSHLVPLRHGSGLLNVLSNTRLSMTVCKI